MIIRNWYERIGELRQERQKFKIGCVSETLNFAGDPLRNPMEHVSYYSHHRIRRPDICPPSPIPMG